MFAQLEVFSSVLLGALTIFYISLSFNGLFSLELLEAQGLTLE